MIVTFQNQLDEALAKLLNRAITELPDFGDFLPIREIFPNLDAETQKYVSSYGLQIYKMPANVVPDPKKRYIEAKAYMPGGYAASMVVGSGPKDEILELLSSKDFALKLNKNFGELLYDAMHP